MGIVHSGERNPNWRGGRTVTGHGYVLVRLPDHPLADVRGYVYEHRLVAEQLVGRPLEPGEQIHHKNGIKSDNRAENLEVMPSMAHHRLQHRNARSDLRLPDEPNPAVECACGCGYQFLKYDSAGRPRKFVSGHNTGVRHG